jgi:3-methyladenine DNA glycosylase Tag
MDKFDVMEVNELQRKRIEELLEEAGQMLRFIRHKEKIIKTQQEYIADLESQLQNLKDQIDQQTDWRNYVQ